MVQIANHLMIFEGKSTVFKWNLSILYVAVCIPSRRTFAPLKISKLFPFHNRILYLDFDTYLIYDMSQLFTVPFQTFAGVVLENQLII
jgi:lipopolysaccharide biosynthesis glycosyltransferase